MAQTSRHISVGKSPDFLMTRGEIEINHQAVLKVYRVDSVGLVLSDSMSPFDRSLAVVMEKLKHKLVAYGWSNNSNAIGNDRAPHLITIVTGSVILCLVYKLEPHLRKNQSEELTDEFNRVFNVDLPIK